MWDVRLLLTKKPPKKKLATETWVSVRRKNIHRGEKSYMDAHTGLL